MLKSIIALFVLVILSAAVIIAMPWAQQCIEFIITAHHWVAQGLTEVFSGGSTGNTIRNVIALLIIPFLVGFIPVIFYWLAKRHWFPHFMELVWVVWLIQTAAIVIQKVAAS